MAMRRKNLLEAFKQSRPAAPPPDAPAASTHSASSSSSSSSQASQASQAAPLFESTARAGRGPRARPVGALVAIGLVVAFVLGFLVGRGSDGEAQAGESALPEVARTPPASQPRAFQERQPASGAGAAPAAQGPAPSEVRIEDSALFDARNLVTVVVASYTKSNQEYAWATYEHLHAAGLPVFPPVESRNLVLVLAGAAPSWDDLEKTEASVKALTRDGKKPYADAYRVRIDTLVPRTQQSTPKKGT